MRNHFDYISKQIGQKALRPLGATVAQDAITSETQYADLRHEPDPAQRAERDRIGLLGQLTARACPLETYSDAPSAGEFRACLAKHLADWQQRARDARAESKKRDEPPPRDDTVGSFLWIIAAGVPMSLMTKLRLEAATGWPPGIYLFGDDVLRVGIVVASELPRDRTTLLIRLMAAGPLLTPAIEELYKLPDDAPERTIAEPILLQFQDLLGQKPTRTGDEQEVFMAMLKSWKETRAEGHAEGRVEGRAEGRVEGHAEAVLAVLCVRGIGVPDAVRERILAEKDVQQLMHLLKKAAFASSIEELFDHHADPSTR